MRLKRYERALRNLYGSMQNEENLDGVQTVVVADENESDTLVGNAFEQCMSLISKYQLHGVGLELFKDDQEKKRTIMLSLGQNLLEQNKPESALTVFLAIKPMNIEEAMKAARACRNWKVFFSLWMQEGSNGNISDSQKKAASEFAEEIAVASERQSSSRGGLADAARILLDYCEDVTGAVDMLVRGKYWQEGCRIAALHRRKDLTGKCVEAAISFAENTVVELEERSSTFTDTMKRYDEVLEIRKEAARAGEAGFDEVQGGIDDLGSVFSAATNASNMSLQSNMSSDSLSSVISVKSITSFSISGAEEATRHKSKFNQIGGKNKKNKKKKKQGRRRMVPGSAEELKSLIETLRSSCADRDLSQVIFETIEFLAQTDGAMDTAKELYKSYVQISDAIQESQDDGREARQKARLAEPHKIPITLPEEDEVVKLLCPKLPDSISEVFAIL